MKYSRTKFIENPIQRQPVTPANPSENSNRGEDQFGSISSEGPTSVGDCRRWRAAMKLLDSTRASTSTGDQSQRQYATQKEHRTPSESRDEPSGKIATGRGPEAVAAPHHRNQTTAQPSGRGFGDQCDAVRHKTAEAKPGQEADRHQPFKRGDDGAEDRERAEARSAADQYRLAPQSIGEWSGDQSTQHRPRQPRTEYRPKCGAAAAQFLQQRRRDVADGLCVESVEEEQRHRHVHEQVSD